MRRATLSLILLPVLGASASTASAGGLDIRLGAFIPRASSNLFVDDESLYFVSKDDWVGFTGGVEYNQVLVPNLELGIHVDGYGKTIETSYRDYAWDDGGDIYQTLQLAIVPFGLTVRIVPTNKRTKIAPYIGGGVDLFYWKYEEWGDFIDFWDPELPVYADAFLSSGVAFGWHATGGIRFYLNRDFALVVEGRYQWAEDTMGGDFAPNEPGLYNTIDLGGTSVVFGLHMRF